MILTFKGDKNHLETIKTQTRLLVSKYGLSVKLEEEKTTVSEKAGDNIKKVFDKKKKK